MKFLSRRSNWVRQHSISKLWLLPRCSVYYIFSHCSVRWRPPNSLIWRKTRPIHVLVVICRNCRREKSPYPNGRPHHCTLGHMAVFASNQYLDRNVISWYFKSCTGTREKILIYEKKVNDMAQCAAAVSGMCFLHRFKFWVFAAVYLLLFRAVNLCEFW